MGADIDCRNNPKHVKPLQDAMNDLISSTTYFAQSLPLYKIYPTAGLKRFNNAMDTLYEIGHMYTNSHLERIKESAKKGEKVYGMSLLEQWLIDDNMTEQEAVRYAIIMLAGGLDTVKYSNYICIYFVNRQQILLHSCYMS